MYVQPVRDYDCSKLTFPMFLYHYLSFLIYPIVGFAENGGKLSFHNIQSSFIEYSDFEVLSGFQSCPFKTLNCCTIDLCSPRTRDSNNFTEVSCLISLFPSCSLGMQKKSAAEFSGVKTLIVLLQHSINTEKFYMERNDSLCTLSAIGSKLMAEHKCFDVTFSFSNILNSAEHITAILRSSNLKVIWSNSSQFDSYIIPLIKNVHSLFHDKNISSTTEVLHSLWSQGFSQSAVTFAVAVQDLHLHILHGGIEPLALSSLFNISTFWMSAGCWASSIDLLQRIGSHLSRVLVRQQIEHDERVEEYLRVYCRRLSVLESIISFGNLLMVPFPPCSSFHQGSLPAEDTPWDRGDFEGLEDHDTLWLIASEVQYLVKRHGQSNVLR